MPLQPKPRPAFAAWRWERNLSNPRTAQALERAAGALGLEGFTCSSETVRLVCLHFGDARRRVPGLQMMAAIGKLTEGQITERHFHAPQAEAA